MKKLALICALLGWSSLGNAELQSMDNQQLQQVDGQAAAVINWQLSLNQTTPGVFDTTTCNELQYCRFGIAFNNRADATGKKQWLVFKGVQGSIRLRDVELDGADLIYTDDANAPQVKAALQLKFDETKPIEIRGLGFSALSIETDSDASEATAGFIPGYLAMGSGGTANTATAYSAGKYALTSNAFDFGRETGFTGLTMNGNLALQGTLKVFSCSTDMKRC